MKNDKIDDDLYEAFNQLDTAVSDLRAVEWIMKCMSDPSDNPPEGLHHTDLGYFFAKLIARQAEVIEKITGAAREQLRERRQAAR